MIRHLRHNEIDKERWDASLLQCVNRMWYAQSWVLDCASPGWEALVDDSVQAVMPLTHRRKWGIDYLFQPLGLQQLGVFAAQPSAEVHARFMDALPKRFRYADILLNEAMQTWELDDDRLIPCTNQVLPLNAGVEQIRAAYAKGHRRNLKERYSVSWSMLSATEFTRLFAATTGKRYGRSALRGLAGLTEVIEQGIANGQCEVVALSHEGKPIAAACFATWQGRTILLKSANTEEGHDARAMFRIVDAWIERMSGRDLLLDFAGSNTPSVARFNAGFGAQPKVYLRLMRNRLPLPLRWIKR
ncbi:MAG: GNAT family N-acetyltransferase [Flavobacteriales bacterium]|nr:GNAT family N-acetyltransferase [Flavobacteriales bacterium]